MTSATHPVDSAGVPLPDPSWPDAPGVGGGLDVVRRLCNSINREQGGEAWRDLGELAAWLGREGYVVAPLAPHHLDEVLALRDALWRSIEGRTLEPLDEVLAAVPFTAAAADGTLRLVAGGDPVHAVAVRLVEVVLAAQVAGRWYRLKSCQRCHWVFVDHSRNLSGRWCSMSACGGREKARAYRSRRRMPG